MLDRWKWGTGCSGSYGWFGTLIPDRVGAVASLLIVGREVDDEARVLVSALHSLKIAYL
jgi:hypothetical protein